MKCPRRTFLQPAARAVALTAMSPVKPPYIGYCIMSAVLLNIMAGFVALPRSHAETSTETFLSIVKNERIRVCATSPISTCESDFEVAALFAEWLDTEEERAIKFDKSNDDGAAKDLRFQILQYAALLDICMEQIRLRHLKK